ncbi:hypothetical protein LZ31DRAFT_542765 [Colletotrichum somersetense]|nr:hypothetical protein LZ31DRAFT_542765 [Colletotrichum somersetense]
MVESSSGSPFDVPYGEVRKKHLFSPHVLQEVLPQEDSEPLCGDWEEIPPPRTMALTQLDIKAADGLPEGGRRRVPETINFHPLWIKFQRSRNFGGWSEDDFAEVPRFDALEEFKRRGAAQNPPRGHSPSGRSAYQVIHGERVARDLYAIIGAVIELRNRDGQKYSVSAAGEVSPTSS